MPEPEDEPGDDSDPELHTPEAERRKRYWGLRPRRSIRRWSLVAIAVALGGVLAAEALWMMRHAP